VETEGNGGAVEIRPIIEEALGLLGKRRLVLSIHDGSFPGEAEEDIGRGTPYGTGGRAFVEFVRRLGFNGVQLGPQGQTSRGNPSPYDSTAMSRNVLSISLAALRRDSPWGWLVDGEELEAATRAPEGGSRDRVQYEHAFDTQARLLRRAYERFERLRSRHPAASALAGRLAGFRRRHRSWLEPDALYDVLASAYGEEDWTRWTGSPAARIDRRLFCPEPGAAAACGARREELRRLHRRRIGLYELGQLLAHEQHGAFHREARRLGLTLYADLQIGLSFRDAWALQPLFLDGYRLGAPPSRTNPGGQPWGYPVFDPDAYRRPPGAGPSVLDWLRRRADRLFTGYDGLRIDHPQGLVCPWVYRADDADPLHALRNGARLFESPHLADHPRLARYAIARLDQLACDPDVRRYDDGWVLRLEPEQVERYAVLLAEILAAARSRRRDPRDVACEILSTLPYPLARVIERCGLGRFRVTQKASLGDPRDVYRSENAEERDWIMLGTHDTPPIWRVVEGWRASGESRERAAFLARRLAPDGSAGTLQAALAGNPGEMVHAMLADALASRAEHVLVFFADLFGIREIYNHPGTVRPDNWSLRVPHDYQRTYPEKAARLEALNLPYALALALRSRRGGQATARTSLAGKLEAAARAVR
jgi:4-alpha-glucanotransferase